MSFTVTYTRCVCTGIHEQLNAVLEVSVIKHCMLGTCTNTNTCALTFIEVFRTSIIGLLHSDKLVIQSSGGRSRRRAADSHLGSTLHIFAQVICFSVPYSTLHSDFFSSPMQVRNIHWHKSHQRKILQLKGMENKVHT